MAGPKRILIVDDEQDIRTYLSTLLEDQGFETVLAKDGEEAMQKIQAGPPDLITLDISMPEKSGVKFFREMKTDDRWKHIPIIIVTGVSEDFKNIHLFPPSGTGPGWVRFKTHLSGRNTGPRPHANLSKETFHGILSVVLSVHFGVYPCSRLPGLPANDPSRPCPLGNLPRPA